MTGGDRVDDEVKGTPVSGGQAARTANAPRRPRLRLGVVVALAVAAGFVAWLVLRGDSNSPKLAKTAAVQGSRPGAAPVAMARTGLRKLQSAVKHPIYWAGPKSGYRYEVTQKRDGTIYVRYLPAGVRVGDPRGAFLIVVTYPYANGLLALKRVAKSNGIRVPGGGLALVHQGYPESVHLAYPRVNYQIEVYDPRPRVARLVAISGRVRPIT